MTKTCPNCGAPVSGWECNYCGAVFYDFSSIDVSFDKPIFIRFKHEGKVVETKARLTGFNFSSSPEYLGLYCDDQKYSCIARVHSEINMGFDVQHPVLVKEEQNEIQS